RRGRRRSGGPGVEESRGESRETPIRCSPRLPPRPGAGARLRPAWLADLNARSAYFNELDGVLLLPNRDCIRPGAGTGTFGCAAPAPHVACPEDGVPGRARALRQPA